MHQLILASQSPRRLELLKAAGFSCRVDLVKVSEIIDENLNLDSAVAQVAADKAMALARSNKYPKGQGFLILSGDTLVAVDGRVLGKPQDFAQAVAFLRLLSGRSHRVISGIAVYDVDKGQIYVASDSTEVEFNPLDLNEIESYVRSGAPMDKAGAYGIQDAACQRFVRRVTGSWSNVVGLPIELFERMISQYGWELARTGR